MPAAVFVARATVTVATKREAFSAWYSREHLPDAMKSFGAVKAWRYWSASAHQRSYGRCRNGAVALNVPSGSRGLRNNFALTSFARS